MFCKICQSPITQQTVLKNGKIYHHCHQCDFSYLDPQFHLSPTKEKLRYDQHQNTSDNTKYTEIFKRFIETAIAPYPVTRVLDYGCGPNPVLATMLKEHGYNSDIYDPYYFPTEPQAESYDLITSTEVFEHLRNPLETLNHILKLLKSNAYLTIMTKFLCPIDQFSSWRYKDDTTHISFYSPKTFSQISDLDLIKTNNQDIVILRKKPSKLN